MNSPNCIPHSPRKKPSSKPIAACSASTRRARQPVRTHIDVPRFIKKIASGNLRGSALTILDSNILGLSCSRVCPVDVLCEGSCVMHRYNKQPIEIGRLQRHAMESFYGEMESRHWAGLAAPIRHPQRIACIGAGPASLACAAELRKLGYAVTLYEARQLPGGLNTYGVAEYKFTPEDSAREIAFVTALGVEIRTGVTVGADITFDQLETRFDAIFLGGRTRARRRSWAFPARIFREWSTRCASLRLTKLRHNTRSVREPS